MKHLTTTPQPRTVRWLALLLLASLALLRCDFFDIFPPEIEIVTPKEGTSYFAILPVEVKATDNRTVTKVEVFLDGESVHEFTKNPYKTDISLDGVSSPATLKALAHDQAGNSAEASRDVNVTIGLKLTSPNGGETWAEQSTQSITWESSGNVGSTVSLHYSTDGGNTWDEISGSTANNGTYAWTLPNFIETQSACKIKVSTSQYADVSDDTFTINAEPNTLTLTSPNGGEVWAEQSTQTITWNRSGDVGDHVSLGYSIDGGTNWSEIIASTSNDGSHAWNIPNFLDTQSACRVRVASTSTAFADTSDADFTITTEPNFISLTSPNGGEIWAEQSTQTILWTYGGDVGDYVSLHLSLDNGSSWNQIVASTPNDGSYDWSLPNLFETATTCLMRVNGTSTSFADSSDSDFTITAEPNYITLTSPNGGETWPEQSTHDITWNRSGDVGNNVSLHYSTDGGATWTQIISPTENDGTHSWILPNFIETQSACRVKVVSTSTTFADTSNADFVITVVPEIFLISPNGGEIWREWSSYTITWISSGDVGSYVNLLYSIDSGNSWTEIAGSILNSGSFSWTLPTIDSTISSCRVQITNTTGSTFDISDSDFTIQNWEPVPVGIVSMHNARKVTIQGDYAYVADLDWGLHIVNISDQTNLSITGSYSTPGRAYDLFVSGGFAYVADYYELLVVDISDPTNPNLASSIVLRGTYGIFVSGNYAYVSGDSLTIVSISDPANPSIVGSCDLPGYAYCISVDGDYSYVGDNDGMQVINVSDPANPVLVNSYKASGEVHEIIISNSSAYLVDYGSDLHIIDVSDPTNPTLIGRYNTKDYAEGVAISGSYAYVANSSSGLQVICITDPGNPILAGNYDTSGLAADVSVSGNYIYVADGSSLLVLDISGLP